MLTFISCAKDEFVVGAVLKVFGDAGVEIIFNLSKSFLGNPWCCEFILIPFYGCGNHGSIPNTIIGSIVTELQLY